MNRETLPDTFGFRKQDTRLAQDVHHLFEWDRRTTKWSQVQVRVDNRELVASFAVVTGAILPREMF
jgi:hypothetical protein